MLSAIIGLTLTVSKKTTNSTSVYVHVCVCVYVCTYIYIHHVHHVPPGCLLSRVASQSPVVHVQVIHLMEFPYGLEQSLYHLDIRRLSQ